MQTCNENGCDGVVSNSITGLHLEGGGLTLGLVCQKCGRVYDYRDGLPFFYLDGDEKFKAFSDGHSNVVLKKT